VLSIIAMPSACCPNVFVVVLSTSYRVVSLASSKKGEASSLALPNAVLSDDYLPATGIHDAQSVHVNAIG